GGVEGIRKANAAQVAFGPAALIGEFAGYLAPAIAGRAHDRLVGDEGFVDGQLVELVGAGHVDDRPDGESLGVLEVDDELREAGMAGFFALAGAHQGDRIVIAMRESGPDLAARDEPAAIDLDAACAHRCEVRTRIRLAHPDREETLAGGDARQVLAALLFGAEAQQQRPALAVGDPGRRPPRIGREQFLGDDQPFEHAALAAAIGLRPGHADPAALAEAAGEVRVVMDREIALASPATIGSLPGDELANLRAQFLGAGGRPEIRKIETHAGCLLPVVVRRNCRPLGRLRILSAPPPRADSAGGRLRRAGLSQAARESELPMLVKG